MKPNGFRAFFLTRTVLISRHLPRSKFFPIAMAPSAARLAAVCPCPVRTESSAPPVEASQRSKPVSMIPWTTTSPVCLAVEASQRSKSPTRDASHRPNLVRFRAFCYANQESSTITSPVAISTLRAGPADVHRPEPGPARGQSNAGRPAPSLRPGSNVPHIRSKGFTENQMS
jgi:hypothetical protein